MGTREAPKWDLELIKDPVVVIDKDYNLLYLNGAAKRLFGTPGGNKKCYEHLFGFKKPCWNYSGYICPVKESRKGGAEAETFISLVKAGEKFEKRIIRQYRLGEEFFCELYLPYWEIKNLLSEERDRFKRYDEVYISKEELEQLLHYKLAKGERFFLTLINIKKLKHINEIYGVKAGDLVIQATEQVLGQLAAKFPFKFGQIVGGMFVVVPQMELEKLLLFEEELWKRLKELQVEYLHTKIKPRYTITTVEVSPSFIKHLKDLFRLLFYAEKRSDTKGVFHFFEEHQREFIRFLKEREEYTQRVEDILHRRAVTFYLQPIVDLQKGEISHFETLMRFIERDGKVVSAGVYIDLIYEMGLIVDFDTLLLEALDREKEKLTLLGKPIFLNITDEDLRFLSYRKRLQRLIETFKGRGIEVNLELTEQVLFRNWEFIEALADTYRLKFAVDDFGTGYSSLKMVADVVQKGLGKYLKLDCSLIKEFHDNEYIQALVESVVAFAKKTELKIIAECVETEREAELLRSLGIHYGQGWYFYRPMPLEELLKLFDKTQ